MKIDGSDFREVTGGDTVDSAPAWVQGAGSEPAVVFESTGIARTPQGVMLGYGPTSIQLLDLGRGTLTAVLDDASYDHLGPRVGRDGALYFIRRPYESPQYSSGNFLVDVAMFPIRLVRALFHYLNFFSLTYSRKPLTSASGPLVEADIKELMVKNRKLDAEKALRDGTRIAGTPSLVPASWELVRRDQHGQEQTLARHVVAFDLDAADRVVYTNGYGVFSSTAPSSA